MNHYGYRTADYTGSGCTACGVCFMVCPEPGAITVYQAISQTLAAARAAFPGATAGARECTSN